MLLGIIFLRRFSSARTSRKIFLRHKTGKKITGVIAWILMSEVTQLSRIFSLSLSLFSLSLFLSRKLGPGFDESQVHREITSRTVRSTHDFVPAITSWCTHAMGTGSGSQPKSHAKFLKPLFISNYFLWLSRYARKQGCECKKWSRSNACGINLALPDLACILYLGH